MCGITGWVNWGKDLNHCENVLKSMADKLACRGPDASGIWLSQHAALGHCRLIVIDPEGGAQPMTRRRGKENYIITYNGELYNTQDLRRELESRGHTFQTSSDTDVLLVSYLEWGKECLSRLNGIFAFAIWDEAGQELFLARDRLGVKPLFYTLKDDSFLFGSELKALLAHPEVDPVVGDEGLAEVFVLGPARTPGHGVFTNISEIKPGHYLIFNRNGIKHHPYWTLNSMRHQHDLETTISRVRELLQDAVKRQLVSDVPVGVLLSGGLDSSALAAFAARNFDEEGRGPLKTFSVDYVGNDQHFKATAFQPNSDAAWIPLVSNYLGTRHDYFFIDTHQLVASLIAAMRARDLPGMADVDSSLYLFCQEIKKSVTVALSGECADEVFGGYPWFFREDALGAQTFPWSLKIKERLNLLSPELIKKIRPLEYADERYRQAMNEVPRLAEDDPSENRMRELFYLNLTRWMPVLLDRKDRMSMATGLEVRVPYCDHRLVEYVWNIPWAMKCVGQKEKGLLRRALRGMLPAEVLERRKSPYPKTHNPAYLAAVKERVKGILDDNGSPLLQLINVAAFREIIKSDLAGFELPWFGQLMTGPQLLAYIIQIEAWLKEYHVEIR